MKPDDLIRIRHMIQAADAVARFVAGHRRTDLDTDMMLLFALVHAIEIIGEAASRLSPEFREATASVPWPAIIGMRNRLIHVYFDIDPEVVWVAATKEVPDLRALLLPLLAPD